MGEWVVKGCPRARAARCTGRPLPASRVLRIAARRPAAAPDPAASAALGQASSLADYDVVKKRLVASDYVMNFDNGVTFDLNVKTSDNMTAASLASLLKAGVLYRKLNASRRPEALRTARQLGLLQDATSASPGTENGTSDDR